MVVGTETHSECVPCHIPCGKRIYVALGNTSTAVEACQVKRAFVLPGKIAEKHAMTIPANATYIMQDIGLIDSSPPCISLDPSRVWKLGQFVY